MTRAGRPTVGPLVHVHLPAELIEDLDREAQVTGEDRSKVIRRRLVLASPWLGRTDGDAPVSE